MPPTAAANPATSRRCAIDLLKFSRHWSNEVLKGWPPDKFTFQRAPTDNHPLWVMGHLAGTDKWIAGVLGIPNVLVPDDFQKFFGQGTTPTADASAYPATAAVVRVFEGSRAALLKGLETLPDSVLAAPLTEKTGGFASDGIDAAMKLAWHEGWHFGQVASIRKALGLPLVFG